MRGRRHRLGHWSIVLVVVALAAACTPAKGGSAADPRPAAWAAQLQAKLGDPTFVAGLGSTDAERAQAVSDIQAFIANPSADFDPNLFDQFNAVNQAESDAKDIQDADARAAALVAAGEARQKEVAGPLLGAPSYDEVKGQGSDVTPDADAETAADLAKKPGIDEMANNYATRMNGVKEALASGKTAGDPLASSLAEMGYGPDLTIASGGPCDGRTGTRHAPTGHNNVPNHDLRPGTIYTPTQDTFAGTTGPNRPVYAGDLQTRTVNGVEQFLVEGHLIDTLTTDSVLAPIVGSANTQTYTTANIDLFQLHLFLQVPGVAQPLEYWGGNNTTTTGAEWHYLCYAEDAALPQGASITRGYFQAWLPMTNIIDSFSAHEPGFQVRSSIADGYWVPSGLPYLDTNCQCLVTPMFPYSYFFGGDQRSVHVGPQPLAHHDAVTGGVGATLNSGFLVDDNGQGDDDLESLAVGPLTNLINSKIPGADGQDGWVTPAYYHLNNVNPGQTSVNLSLAQLHAQNNLFQPDDEYALAGDVDLSNIYIDAQTWGANGGCYGHFKVDAKVHATATLDIAQTPSAITPDVHFWITDLHVHDQFWVGLGLCAVNYVISSSFAEKKITKAVSEAVLADLPEHIANLVSSRADMADYINHNVTIGTQGNGFQTGFAAFDHTCVPYGCDGAGSGDIGMVSSGLEIGGDLLVTDRKTTNATRRFPFSYNPSTNQPVSTLIRSHATPAGATYSAAAFASGATMNQLLRSITEGGPGNHGILDTSMVTGGALNLRPQVAPIFLKQSISGKTLGLFIGDLRVDNGGYERLAANLAVGLDVTYDPSTGALDPSTIGVTDVAAGLSLYTLRCSSVLWSVCTGVPQVISSLATELGTNLLPQLTHNTIAQVTLPSVAGMPILWADLQNVDGNLAAFLKVGAPHVSVSWVSTTNGGFDFHATPINFVTNPATYQWVLTDDVTGAVLLTDPNGSQDISIPISSVPQHGQLLGPGIFLQNAYNSGPPYYTPVAAWRGDCVWSRRVRATAVGAQSSTSAQGTATAFTFGTSFTYAQTQAGLAC